MKQSPQKPEPASPKKPDAAPERVLRIVDPDHSMEFAVFTPRELDTLRSVCRDSDNELGIRALNAALARGGK